MTICRGRIQVLAKDQQRGHLAYLSGCVPLGRQLRGQRNVSSIELNHIGTQRISAFHQSQELSIGPAARSYIRGQSHQESAGIAARSCVRGQSQKESAEGRYRNAFGIIEHRHRTAAAIDDRQGKDPAIGSAGRITLWCASFRSG
jgi:hypothetical protein